MGETAINFAQKFAKFSEQWSPKIIPQMNDYHFKIVKIQGEFVWQPAGTPNTGDAGGARTAEAAWI